MEKKKREREFLTHGSEREAVFLPSLKTDGRLPYGAVKDQTIGAPLIHAVFVLLTQVSAGT